MINNIKNIDMMIDNLEYKRALNYYKDVLWRIRTSSLELTDKDKEMINKTYLKLLLYKKLEGAVKIKEKEILKKQIEDIRTIANLIGKEETPLINFAEENYKELIKRLNRLEIEHNNI